MNACTNEDIIQLLIESDALAEGDEVLVDAPLKQMGIQSLDKFNLFLLVEERHGVQIPDEDFEKLDTVSAIAAYVSEKQAV
ncbi:MAG: acyl carrier protein [Verrucomicrobiae bacterium]|nr:acyl carrier protein [Verrucomicrobiae bacterium]